MYTSISLVAFDLDALNNLTIVLMKDKNGSWFSLSLLSFSTAPDFICFTYLV